MADLVRLAERLGCRDDKPHALPSLEAVCLARGASAILAAIERVGWGCALSQADPAAATCLGHSLMQAVGDVRRRWLPSCIRGQVEWACAILIRPRQF